MAEEFRCPDDLINRYAADLRKASSSVLSDVIDRSYVMIKDWHPKADSFFCDLRALLANP